MNQSKPRARKISLQNDYAFCIISPVPPSLLPAQNQTSVRSDIPGASSSILIGNIGLDALALENTPSRGFDRWSISNYQQLRLPVSPNVSEFTSDFASDDETSCQISRSSSSSSMNWLSGIFSNIPERIRKLSTEKNKFDVNRLHEDEEIRDQLKKMYVF